jgi:D-sedoheptulose 7-phosphate isomerase
MSWRGGGTLFFCGNGGSAGGRAAHGDGVRRAIHEESRALPAVALTTDTSLLTAVGNDFGFDDIFARQVDALVTRARPAHHSLHEWQLA